MVRIAFIRLRSRLSALLVWVLLLGGGGCTIISSERGVPNNWGETGGFELGVTTRNEVLAALGPPSQVLSLESETIFYYLLEKTQGRGVTLVLYNFRGESTSYERAIFFFGSDGLLTDYATADAAP